jgi:hypothetical protein
VNRKVLLGISTIVLMTLFVSPVLAIKPAGNPAGSQTVAWNLSGDVMPVPPYGSRDIPGSDTASKLIFSQPNGEVEVAITGVMNGLHPNTEYTVYLSKSYTPYVFTGWSIVGDWVIRFTLGSNYDHDIIITTQNDGSFSGYGGWPAGGPYSITETVKGNIDVMSGYVTFHSEYNNGYWYDATGTIASDGTMSGTWGNTIQGYGYTWSSISGRATKTHTGDTSWPGLFTDRVPPFTFITDEYGSGSWHINLRDSDFPESQQSQQYTLSVWINEAGATILISDNFSVQVEANG